MKKMFFMAAIAALALSSCSSDEIVASQTIEDGAVSFSAYAGRANRATLIETAQLKDAASTGFGVFAYEQGKKEFATYSSTSSYPNFFYNQQVKYNTSATKWEYSPIKYFSNNEGALHSFFAYAPYDKEVENVFTLGKAPAIRYNAADDYDLLWAAVPNIGKKALDQTVDFTFQHALSQVNIYVAPFVDAVHEGAHTTGLSLLDNVKETTINVRSVKFIGTVASQGLLNLENGYWTVEATDESAYEITTPVVLDKDNNTTTTAKYKPVKEKMMVIPSKNLQIQIVYDVITPDTENPANSSVITNTITSKTVDGYTLVAGQAYNFYLDLGMKSVQFTAAVAPAWLDAANINVDLPNNTKAELLTLTPALNEKAAPISLTFGDSDTNYSYDGTKLKLKNDESWGAATTVDGKVYQQSGTQNLYLATNTDGTATEYTNVMAYESETSGTYIVWTGSTYASKEAKTVKSLIPDSAGKLYLVTGNTEVTPATNDVLIYDDKVYIWK